MNRLVMVLIVFAIILILYLGTSGTAKDPKPATQHASQAKDPVTAQDFGSALQNTIDQKFKLGMQARFNAQLGVLRNALANTGDADAVAHALSEQDLLIRDLDEAKGSLVLGGHTPAEIDAWLAKTAWPEVDRLGQQLKGQGAPAPTPAQ
jgi:hypothetical protein